MKFNLKEESKIFIFLILLSPALGELLSSSSPPGEFFNPLTLLTLILLYGFGALLIRELRVRWNLQWSIIFLAVAYGIIEEGLLTKSFFNPGWEDLQALSAYGMYLGIQWPWTIMLIFFHSTISTLIPIKIVDLLWPAYKNKPLLNRKGFIYTTLGLIFITLVGFIFAGTKLGGKIKPFYPNPVLSVSSLLSVFLLIYISFLFKDKRIISTKTRILSPIWFGIVGFLSQGINLFLPYIFATLKINDLITIFFQITFIIFMALFFITQILNSDVTNKHIYLFISGSLLFFILLCFLNPKNGMVFVGVFFLLFLYFVGRFLKEQQWIQT